MPLDANKAFYKLWYSILHCTFMCEVNNKKELCGFINWKKDVC